MHKKIWYAILAGIIGGALLILLSGCALIEVVEYRQIERIPVEPPVAATTKPEKPLAWYRPIIEGIGSIIQLEPVVAIIENARLLITDTAETLANAVRDVKTQTQYTETRVKVVRILGTGDTEIKVDKEGAEKK